MLSIPQPQENGMAQDREHPPTDEKTAGIGESRRDYPHGSGDRNTKKSETDWRKFEGGKQRDAPPAPPRDAS